MRRLARLLALTASIALPGLALPGFAMALLGGCGSAAGGSGPAPVEAVIGEIGKEPGCFVSPRAIAFDPRSGLVCVVDRSGRIQCFRFDEDFQRKAAAADPVAASTPDLPPAPGTSSGWKLVNLWQLPEIKLGQPTGLAFDSGGNLLVADTHYQRILVYDPGSGRLLRSFGSEGSGDGQFFQVRDVVQDGAGAIYAADFGGPEDRIQKFDAAGNFLKKFGTRGQGPGQLQRAQGLAIARGERGEETLLIADSCNHRVQRFSLDGEFLEMWGKVGEGPGEFKYPYGIAVENRPGGEILVVEWGNNRIQRFDCRGGWLGSWGRPGREPGELATPWDIAIGPGGRILVVDFGNHRVQVFRWPGMGSRSEPSGGER